MNFFRKISFLFLTLALSFVVGINFVEAQNLPMGPGTDSGIAGDWSDNGIHCSNPVPNSYNECDFIPLRIPTNTVEYTYQEAVDWNNRIWNAVCIDGYDGTEDFLYPVGTPAGGSCAAVTETPTLSEGPAQGYCRDLGYDYAEGPDGWTGSNGAASSLIVLGTDAGGRPDDYYYYRFWNCFCGDGSSYNETTNDCEPDVIPDAFVDLKANGGDDPISAIVPEDVVFSWSGSNIENCVANTSITSLPDSPQLETGGASSGSETLSFTSDTLATYIMTCDNIYDNSIKVTDTIGVAVTEPPTFGPVVVTFDADPNDIWEGDSTTLSWTTEGPDNPELFYYCDISADGDLIYNMPELNSINNGTLLLSPNTTTTY